MKDYYAWNAPNLSANERLQLAVQLAAGALANPNVLERGAALARECFKHVDALIEEATHQ